MKKIISVTPINENQNIYGKEKREEVSVRIYINEYSKSLVITKERATISIYDTHESSLTSPFDNWVVKLCNYKRKNEKRVQEFLSKFSEIEEELLEMNNKDQFIETIRNHYL